VKENEDQLGRPTDAAQDLAHDLAHDLGLGLAHDLDLSGPGPSLLTRLAIDSMGAWGPHDPRIEEVRQLARALSRASASIDLRLTGVCCFIQQQDLRVLGYASFGSFIREAMDWQPSWQRQIARLLRSDLDRVKRAAITGAIPLTTAVGAPGHVDVDGQEAWLQAVLDGSLDRGPPRRGPEDDVDVLSGDDAATVRRARKRARLLLGQPVPSRVADRQILDWFTQGALPSQLLEQARQAPPPPDLSAVSWPADLDELDDPATPLVGPWRDPVDLDDALKLVDRLTAARRKRRAVLGRLLDQIKYCWLFLDWGHGSFDDWVRAELDLSLRSAYRLRKAGRTLSWNPQVAVAVDHGLSMERVAALDKLVNNAVHARSWLVIADRLPMAELNQAARDWQDGLAQRKRYDQLLQDAPALVQQALDQRQAHLDAAAQTLSETGAAPTGLAGWDPGARRLGPRALNDGPPDEAETGLDQAAIKVALRRRPADPAHDGLDRGDRWLFTEPGVLEAARWLLDTAQLPPQKGCAHIKEDQDYTCQNPECRRRSLRNHAHHIQPRSLWGTDDEDNLACLWPSCHLRLLHGGFMAVQRVGDAVVYLYPGRAVVVR